MIGLWRVVSWWFLPWLMDDNTPMPINNVDLDPSMTLVFHEGPNTSTISSERKWMINAQLSNLPACLSACLLGRFKNNDAKINKTRGEETPPSNQSRRSPWSIIHRYPAITIIAVAHFYASYFLMSSLPSISFPLPFSPLFLYIISSPGKTILHHPLIHSHPSFTLPIRSTQQKQTRKNDINQKPIVSPNSNPVRSSKSKERNRFP